MSVVVPAHNEQQVIGRLLTHLVPDLTRPDIEVVVVCNGCTDHTASVARGHPGVQVVSTPRAGKAQALRLGDGAVTSFPRLYVDADVEINRADVLTLCAALDEPGVLAVAPARVIPRREASWPVRLYYDVWQDLPQVRAGLFGRGVVAVSRSGHQRLASLPELMADDLAASAVFDPAERRVVDEARVVIHPPRTWADLMRRRVRATTGTQQVYGTGVAVRTDSRTSPADLVDVVRRHPAQILRMPVFLAAAALARRRANRAILRQDYETWLRDDSSRE